MKKAPLSVLLICFALLCCISPARAEDRVPAVKEALARFICYTNFWYEDVYVEGAPLGFEVKFEGDKFYVWADDEKMRPNNGDERIVGIYTGSIKDGRGMIEDGESINVKRPDPPPPQFAEHRQHFESGIVIKDTMTVPSDCTPRYDPMTPRKEVLIKAIVSTMQKTLRESAQSLPEDYPKEVTLVIADFNLDYQFTFVIVEPLKKVYSITLHDWYDYQGDRYGSGGDVLYGIRTMNSFSRETLAETRRHGIVRKITLKP